MNPESEQQGRQCTRDEANRGFISSIGEQTFSNRAEILRIQLRHGRNTEAFRDSIGQYGHIVAGSRLYQQLTVIEVSSEA